MPVRLAFGPTALASGESERVTTTWICPLAWLRGTAVEGVGDNINEEVSTGTLVWPTASDADSVAAPRMLAARIMKRATGCMESSFGEGGLNPRVGGNGLAA